MKLTTKLFLSLLILSAPFVARADTLTVEGDLQIQNGNGLILGDATVADAPITISSPVSKTLGGPNNFNLSNAQIKLTHSNSAQTLAFDPNQVVADIDGNLNFWNKHANGSFRFQNGVNGITSLFLRNNGNVGIRTENPTAALDVVGDAKISGSLTVAGGTVYHSGNIGNASDAIKQAIGVDPSESVVSIGSNGSVAWGENVIAGPGAMAWGEGANAVGPGAMAWGQDTSASASYSTAWGYYSAATREHATAWGWDTDASGDAATAWGVRTHARAYGATAFGLMNISQAGDSGESAETWVATDPLLEVGNGRPIYLEFSNAMTVLKDGRTAIGGHATLATLRAKQETLQVQGALAVGDYAGGIVPSDSGITPGAIRYDGDDFWGYKNGTWVSLTEGGSGGTAEAASALVIPGSTTEVLSVANDGSITMAAQGDIPMFGQ